MNTAQPRQARVLAIHRYFWPDTAPYCALLRVIARHWAESGAAVEVLAGRPSYKRDVAMPFVPMRESLDDFEVRRLPIGADGSGPIRLFRMTWFSILAAWRVLTGPQTDLVMCSTVPQVLLGWFVSAAARLRGSKFVYHCMDLHPEIGAISGEFANRFVYRWLMRLDLATCRRAFRIVVLSEDMKATLISRDSELVTKIDVINNFDLPEFATRTSVAPLERGLDSRVRILFAGNVGRFQNLERVLEAVLGDDPRLDGLELVVLGDGEAKNRLLSRWTKADPNLRRRVTFLQHASISEAREHMRNADVGLVSLVPGVVAYAYPSKVATYLAEGLPILVGVERQSALAQDLVSRGVGTTIDLTSVESARSDLIRLTERKDDLAEMRDLAFEVWREEFSADLRLADWGALLCDVAGPGAREEALQ